MHITFLALGSQGDILPYARLGKGLRSANHRVSFITSENYAPLIEEHGLDFHGIRGDSQTLVAEAGANMFSLMRAFGSLAEGFTKEFPSLTTILENSDAIINQLPLGLYGYDFAEKFSIPMFLAAVIPLTRTTAFPVMGLPTLPIPALNKLTYYIAEQIGWQMFQPMINRWRRQTLGLPPSPISGYFHQLGTKRFPVLNGFSTYVVPRPSDWSPNVHITGYWLPDDFNWEPPADLKRFIDEGPPPVFIGFGSMPIRHPETTTRVILEALEHSGHRGILHAGWASIGDQKLPENVMRIHYAPYSWLFPHMAMVIHHGGSGTTAMGLSAGVPSMAVPFLFDQHYWGKRIADLGVGPTPIPINQLSVDRLTKAIMDTTADQPMRARAAEIGRKIRSENGIENAIGVIRSYLA
jgi:UDP:flavonoid glycosyltransferase YjiC (YdhE family)